MAEALHDSANHLKDIAASPIPRVLQVAACMVIVCWGVRAASSILGVLLISIVLAYAVVPFPHWLMRRFKFPKRGAIAITATAVVVSGFYLVITLDFATVRIEAKLPAYEQRVNILSQETAVFMNSHGIDSPVRSVKDLLTPGRLREVSSVVLPEARVLFSDILLIFLFAFLFIIEMTEDIRAKQSILADRMAYYASDARGYVVVTAKAAAINALLNLAFLLVMGVDTPVIWSLLYFFLDFIPTLGYLIALVPPALVTLLMYGWKRAMLVACGLILTNLIVDNLVTPIFMKHSVGISFLGITLSLVGWTFLLGLPGAIVAIPLTLALRKFLVKGQSGEQFATEL
jgi:AI-2 transport protein TqsA